MILRKPYAILIKYFKLIHIIMFIFFSYFVFSIRKIYLFFSEYIKTSNFTYFDNMSKSYVPGILFVFAIILLALSIGIYLLMHKKEKPVLFYRVMIGYSAFLIGLLIYYVVFFKSLESIVYEPLRIVVNRDISLFTYILNYFFVAVTFIRGFGFDIKKFSFDKDKKELHLDETDNEEYELNVSLEKDDVKSFLNRNKREFIYYFKENKLILSIIGIIILVFAIFYVYYNFFVVNRVYSEGDNITVNKLVYRVNSSTISNTDKYGNEINSQSDYLIINVNVINNYDAAVYIDSETLRVNIDEEYFYPITMACDLFNDLGNCYNKEVLKPNTDNNLNIIYKIKKEYKNMYLEILKNSNNEYQYSKVRLSYKRYQFSEYNYNMNDEFTILDNKLKINNYSLLDKTSYQYEECINNKCSTYTKIVSPNVGESVLTLDISNIDKLSDDFLDSAFGIKYNNIIYSGKDIKLITKYKDKLYYNVPGFIRNTNNIYLIITTRDYRYNILLGGK